MAARVDGKAQLSALLREHGFKGSAPTFRRFVGKDFVALVNLQSTAGEVYVNLGAHHGWLGKPSSWDRILEYQCAFRARLVDFAGSQRFSLGDPASVAALLEMFKLEGLPFFAQLEPGAIPKTTKTLARDGYEAFAPLGPPADAMTWAKVAAHLGDATSAKRFEAQERAFTRALEAERQRERASSKKASKKTASKKMASKKATQ